MRQLTRWKRSSGWRARRHRCRSRRTQQTKTQPNSRLIYWTTWPNFRFKTNDGSRGWNPFRKDPSWKVWLSIG